MECLEVKGQDLNKVYECGNLKDLNITIVGLGLIGGSFAMALKKLNPKNLWAVDINVEALNNAEALGIIDKAYLEPEAPLKESDIIIISMYPELTIKFIKDNMDKFKSGAIITDTAGIKEKVVRDAHELLREDLDFIGGHPMAGRECSGFNFATEEIFKGASYILTPIEKNKKTNLELLKWVIKEIGFKKIVEVSPQEHDRMVAFTSHLPHIIASALANSNMLEDKRICVGGSFKDATRVARINSELWSELLLDNGANVVEQIKLFEEEIERIKIFVTNMDKEGLKEIFKKGSIKREQIL